MTAALNYPSAVSFTIALLLREPARHLFIGPRDL